MKTHEIYNFDTIIICNFTMAHGSWLFQDANPNLVSYTYLKWDIGPNDPHLLYNRPLK